MSWENCLSLCERRILIGTKAPWVQEAMWEKQKLLTDREWSFLYNLEPKGIPYSPLKHPPKKTLTILLEEILDVTVENYYP